MIMIIINNNNVQNHNQQRFVDVYMWSLSIHEFIKDERERKKNSNNCYYFCQLKSLRLLLK